ncbi:MAG: FumA C-terminus/TtdB family hydratase beta subunit [Endomicrobium sp.]|jgi:fumarate hydratase subunit beta|nr:FumA C-terminus/TtdB family hydratase beta subunit [Endomicrobium sp.]
MQKKENNIMKINVKDLVLNTSIIKAGQQIFLSGTIYTARDAAHAKLIKMLENGEKPPFELKNSAIYYCGPSPAKPGAIIGACGPTTSARMDIFTPRMLEEGVKILIGKGARKDFVTDSIKKNKAIYLTATGGVAALLSKTVKQAEIIAFEDLGPEAIYKLEVENMPLTVGIDCN